MSATNHTTNYELPQFIGSDKPAWLGDINPAFGAIDAQMKLNADSASSANAKAVLAEGKADTAKGAVDTLASRLTFTDFQDKTASEILGTISGITMSGNMKLSQNSDGSMFKFYNFVSITNTTESAISIARTAIPGTTGLYGIKVFELTTAPEEAYNVLCAGNQKVSQGSTMLNLWNQSFTVGSDGGIYFMVGNTNTITVEANQSQAYNFYPCLYFNANFGD